MSQNSLSLKEFDPDLCVSLLGESKRQEDQIELIRDVLFL